MATSMNTWAILLAYSFIGALSSHISGHHQPEVPGVEVQIADVPYMASVHDGDTYLCGGVIISHDYVLSSDINLGRLSNIPNNAYVRVGYSHRDHDGVVYNVSQITVVGPLALLRTDTPIEFDTTTQSIELPGQDEAYQTDAPANIVGWGHPGRKDVEGEAHTFLKSLNVTVRTDGYCMDVYSEAMYDSATMICVSGHEGCTGSSPLIQGNRVIGFDGDACGCSEEGLPERFDAVAPLVDRIRGETGE
ncbi:trypsin-1 [Anabrus simplex]|uniref:trypsin-1 n=1 Tax=Anabrus simplex TaxID=316456 RepID=UPI0035A284DB